MLLKALRRFNHHDPGDVFEADDADAKVWIREKLAMKAEKKGADEPAADKAEKSAPVKK